MTIDEAELIAWLDGELAPAEAARVAAAVAVDPALARLAAAHRRVAERLRAGFEPLLAEPAPRASTASNVIDFVRPVAAPGAARRFVMPNWTALAATLVIGLMVGTLIGSGGPAVVATDRDDAVIARGELASALETQLASRQSGAIRVVLTFRGRDGKLCRSWSATTQAGIACRSGDNWAIRALDTAGPQAGEYRTASGESQHLMSTVDALIDGAPFDPAQEARARSNSWR